MNSRPQAWFAQAKDDLAAAMVIRDNNFNSQACYFASQAAEKALKGLILELGVEPAYTHVLGELIKQLKQLGCDVEELEKLSLRSLSRIAAVCRYPIESTPPADLFELADANQAITTAAAVLGFVEALDKP
jgi:HEPN domain-containing protein